jgi:hypothetical protein
MSQPLFSAGGSINSPLERGSAKRGVCGCFAHYLNSHTPRPAATPLQRGKYHCSPFIFTALLLLLSLAGKAGNSFVFAGDTTNKLFWCSNNEIYSPDKQTLLYFQKGNIFFKGETDSRNNIFLLTSSMDFNSDKLELMYEKDNRSATYSFSNNKFYLGKNESADFQKRNELIHVQRAKKWMAFYSSLNDSLLGFYAADSLPSSAAILVAYTLNKKFDLESKISLKQNRLPFDDAPFAIIKPVLGDQTVNEWIWDGKILRPRWNVDPRLAWTFDGQKAKPLNGTNVYDEYSWDGETFKPIWRTNNAEEWSWDGHQFKPVWGNDANNQYIIDNGTVKPADGIHPEKEWRMEGDIPVPMLILIISGIARPY